MSWFSFETSRQLHQNTALTLTEVVSLRKHHWNKESAREGKIFSRYFLRNLIYCRRRDAEVKTLAIISRELMAYSTYPTKKTVLVAHQTLSPLFIAQENTSLAYLYPGLQVLLEVSAAKIHHQSENNNNKTTSLHTDSGCTHYGKVC